jgi:hypothetical protein
VLIGEEPMRHGSALRILCLPPHSFDDPYRQRGAVCSVLLPLPLLSLRELVCRLARSTELRSRFVELRTKLLAQPDDDECKLLGANGVIDAGFGVRCVVGVCVIEGVASAVCARGLGSSESTPNRLIVGVLQLRPMMEGTRDLRRFSERLGALLAVVLLPSLDA